MPLQFSTVEEPSFSRGIDARSAENQIREGFVRDLVNADIVEGRIKKRRGYEAFAGNIPLRVVSYRQPEEGKAIVSLDSSIDLSRVQSCPLYIYGRTSVSTASPNPFTSTVDRPLWVTGWATNLRKYFTKESSDSITATATEHSIPTTDMYVGVSENVNDETAVDTLAGEQLLSSITIDSSREITVDYTNNTIEDVPVFLFYLDRTPVSGEVFASNFTLTDVDETQQFSVLASTHGLATSNILYQLYKQSGTDWVQCKPDAFELSPTGNVSFDVTAEVGTVFRLILSSVPDSQSQEGESPVTLTNMPNSYLFYTCYDGDDEIVPDTVEYNDEDKTVKLTFDGTEVPSSIRVVYEYGTIRTNELYLEDDNIGTSPAQNVSFSTPIDNDPSPQMSVYGISHSIAYGDNKRQERRGWVNHIDSYRSPDDTHMVAGLGGNLYAAKEVDLPTYYPKLRVRSTSEQFLGPAFGPLVYFDNILGRRTRGIYSFTGSNTGWATVTKAEWLAGNTVQYTLSTPNRIKTVGKNPIQVGDYLTLKGMPFSRHNGTYAVSAINDSAASELVIDVTNPAVSNNDYDDYLSGACQGSGGVFSDRFTSDSAPEPNPFLPGDRLLSSSWGEETELYVTESNLHEDSGDVDESGNIIYEADEEVYVSGCYDVIRLGSNLLITGERTSDTVPFRTVAVTPQVAYLAPGDTVQYSGDDSLLQIVSIDTVGKTVTFDSSITWKDDVANAPMFDVVHRWIPVESPSPDAVDALIPTTSVRYFTSDEYGNQSFLRSAMVQDNLYLTNGKDEVYKYDGTHNYRAGIIPWQPGLFLSYETVPSGGIPLASVVADDGGGGGGKLIELVGGRIKIDKTQAAYFSNGDSVILKDDSVATYYLTIASRELETSGNHYYFSFVEPLTFTTLGSGDTVQMILAYTARYSFRLNIKDVNGVTTASAVTGAEDFVARVSPTTTYQQKIYLRLVGLPAWDQYDFRNKNIELEIYRTQWTRGSTGDVPVFFRLPQTKACTFVGPDGYIDIVDTYSNDTVVDSDLVVGTLSPSTVPAAWDEPPRAKYVTTAGNKLVLANLTDWPTLAVSYLSNSTRTIADFNGQKFSFYKDSTSTSASVTDMVNCAIYEFTTNAGTTVTLNAWAGNGFEFTSAGKAIGDWVYLYFTTSSAHPLTYSGWWQISDMVGTTCRVKTTSAWATPTHPINAVFATNSKNIPVFIGVDYNFGMVNGQINGFQAPEIRAIRRLGAAINASMRMATTSSFKPWLVARSESDTYGQLIIKQPRVEDTVPAVKLTAATSLTTYVNGAAVTDSSTVTTATITRYPSRIAASYDNYPEIFDNLWTVDTDESDSVLDINSSDGQEITGIIPFFGQSAFGAAQQSSVLVVFKQNSIYLVDLSAKQRGENAVQKLQTQGLGCTAPYSIAPTKNGIVFANESGIYALRTNQTIEYLGRFMERNWQEKVNLDALAIAQGHQYGIGRQYKLSVPMAADSTATYAENGEVYVYNHTGEGDGELGGWSRYTNHPVTGWANLFQNAFLATANGSVMRVRSSGGVSDYRDANVAIESILEARAVSFGNTGIRKAVSNIVVHYRSGANSENTKVWTSPDLFDEYEESTLFKVITKQVQDGLSSTSGQAVVSIMHSFGRRRCIYMSVKITNNGIDENVEVAGMSYIVAGLSGAGIKQAAETT